MRPDGLEVAQIFRAAGPAFLSQERGHLSLGQLKVMSAIEQCRSAALGGHVLRCTSCQQPQIAYNSCVMGSPPLRGVRVNAPTLYGEGRSLFALGSSPLSAGPWLPWFGHSWPNPPGDLDARELLLRTQDTSSLACRSERTVHRRLCRRARTRRICPRICGLLSEGCGSLRLLRASQR